MPGRFILDQNAPDGLCTAFPGFEVVTARSMGWATLANGDLLQAAEDAGFFGLITCDRNLRYQQNLAGRHIALIEFSTGAWPVVRNHLDLILAAVEAANPGSYTQVSFPRLPLRRRLYPPRLDG